MARNIKKLYSYKELEALPDGEKNWEKVPTKLDAGNVHPFERVNSSSYKYAGRLEVTGPLVIGSVDVMNTLNNKPNKGDSYTKAESDGKYPLKAASYTKAESDGRYYTKADSDNKYALKTASYTKSESDGKYYIKGQSNGPIIDKNGKEIESSSLYIQDARNFGDGSLNFDLTPQQLDDNRLRADFAYIPNAGSAWRNSLTLKGWSGTYAAWQLIGPGSTDADDDLYFRSGHGSTWRSPKKVSFDGHSHAWGEITGKPTTFTPSTHTHTASQISDLPTGATNMTSNRVQFGNIKICWGIVRITTKANERASLDVTLPFSYTSADTMNVQLTIEGGNPQRADVGALRTGTNSIKIWLYRTTADWNDINWFVIGT